MSIDIKPYIPLKTIVSYFLDQYNLGMSSFDKAWIMAFRGLVQLGFSMTFEPKSVRLPVLGNKTVSFPSDYISWTKIGVLNNLGEVSTLKINNGLSIYKDNNPNRLSSLTSDINDGIPFILQSPFFFNYYYNGNYGNLYGVAGGLVQYGEVRVDEANKVFVLNVDFQYSSIILEYLSSPQQDEDYTVPIYTQEALITFIAWKFKLDTDTNFYARATEARRSLPNKKVTKQGINQVIRSTSGMYLHA